MHHVNDIVQAYTDGQISREELIEALASFPYVTPACILNASADELEHELLDGGPYDDADCFDEVAYDVDGRHLDDATFYAILERMEALGV